ncbi:MAG TPA: hypothetical protein VG246_02275 [Acidimicrobiales bacterium]|nr:hypothetical protein [Acidimicrobiales bacterium]
MQRPTGLGGAAPFSVVVVVDATLDVVDGALVDVVAGVDVVVVVPGGELDAMTNPQPRVGSLSVKGSEIDDWFGTDVVGGVVVDVVVVTLIGEVVVVVDDAVVAVVVVAAVASVVVVEVADEFFVTSRPIPVNTRPNNATKRTARSGHRRVDGVFRDAGTLRHGNSQNP